MNLALKVTAKTSAILFCSMFLLLLFDGSALAQDKAKEEEAAEGEEKPEEEKQKETPGNYMCEADVFYSWKRLIKHREPKKLTAEQQRIEDEQEKLMSTPIEVFFLRSGEEGIYESEAKAKLLTRLTSLEGMARKACEDLHENRSRCVSNKLRAYQEEYRFADFYAKKQILDSVNEDCETHYGICLQTSIGEISCYSRQIPGEQDKTEEQAG